MEDANRHLAKLNLLHLSTIETLAMAIDAKDQVTHGHIRRVQFYATELARAMGVQDDLQIRAIQEASLLHDMGKLAVPEYILNKPGPLTPAEFETMKQHASIGAQILSAIEFPYPVVPIVRHHHENWDGTGYPDGVKGDAIPTGARILSVVDCFDALTSDRPYRPRMRDDQAMQIVADRSGTMYDPEVVATFARIQPAVTLAQQQTVATQLDRDALTAITESALPGPEALAARSTPADIAATTDEMLTVYELARSLGGHLSLSDAGDIIAKHLRRMLPVSTVVFYLYDDETNTLLARHVAGDGNSRLTGLRIPLGGRLTGWVGANQRTIANSDPALDFGEATQFLTPIPRSCLSTPLLDHRSLVGVLSLYSASSNAFTEDHKRIAEAVARQIAGTIFSAQQFENDQASSLRDPVTGLPNSKHLETLFAVAASDETLADDPVSLLVIGIEDSVRVKRQHTGDEAIRAVVAATQTTLRGADMLFRHASDELVVLLTQTDADTSSAIARRVRETTEQIACGPEQFRVAVKVGAATAPGDGHALGDLMNVARTRLRTTGRGPARPKELLVR